MKHLKKFFEMVTPRTYEVMDNFDDNRMSISFIGELKELDKWQDFLAIMELDRSTYDNAADAADEKGYSKLSNKFRQHGKEFGLNQERDNVTMVVKARGNEKILNLRITSVESNPNYSMDFLLKMEDIETGKSIIFNVNKYPKKIEFYMNGDYPSLPQTRKDAKKVLDAFENNDLDVNDIDVRSISYDDSGF